MLRMQIVEGQKQMQNQKQQPKKVEFISLQGLLFLKKKNENRPARSWFRTHGDGPLAFGVSHVMVITHVVPGNARSRDSPGTWSLEAASETLAA